MRKSCSIELVETMDHFTVALDEGYISEERVEAMLAMAKEVEKMINGYIRYLKNAKGKDE